jgi:hypothetical protein
VVFEVGRLSPDVHLSPPARLEHIKNMLAPDCHCIDLGRIDTGYVVRQIGEAAIKGRRGGTCGFEVGDGRIGGLRVVARNVRLIWEWVRDRLYLSSGDTFMRLRLRLHLGVCPQNDRPEHPLEVRSGCWRYRQQAATAQDEGSNVGFQRIGRIFAIRRRCIRPVSDA